MDELNYTKFIDENFYENLRIKKDEEIINELKKYYEACDLEIRNSVERKRAGWIVKDVRERTQLTSFGPLIFAKTRYVNKITHETKCLVDKNLRIFKYKKLSFDLIKKFLMLFGKGNRYSDILSSIGRVGETISQMTIVNVIKWWSFKNVDYDEMNYKVPNIGDSEYIYLNIDDAYPTVRVNKQKRKARVRVINAYTGIYKGKYGRNKLLNKRWFYEIGTNNITMNTKELSNVIKEKLYEWYGDQWKTKQVVVSGDGAGVNKKFAKWMNAPFVLDKFHLLKDLRKVLNYSPVPEKRTDISEVNFHQFNYIRSKLKNNYNDFQTSILETIKLLETLIWYPSIKLHDLKLFLSYVRRNKEFIENHFKEWESGCYAEAQISALVKGPIGYGKKIYNVKTYEKILFKNCLEQNQYKFSDVLSFYFYEIEILEIEKRKTNWRQFTVGKINALTNFNSSNYNNNGRAWKTNSKFKN